jgi:hypothetical protein
MDRRHCACASSSRAELAHHLNAGAAAIRRRRSNLDTGVARWVSANARSGRDQVTAAVRAEFVLAATPPAPSSCCVIASRHG